MTYIEALHHAVHANIEAHLAGRGHQNLSLRDAEPAGERPDRLRVREQLPLELRVAPLLPCRQLRSVAEARGLLHQLTE
ncbi:hypothetical protein [Pseudarthrobacter sp. ATCC 49987]|uniref:hypothetical protein n=1 Tax=Pseudarthrobacter sp. ATCC 49987 TaxID=2698204 RepID=UPI00136EFA9C|nr:hypothetical protein [Pseudarthrobacter sp. ATCC 49987]